MSNLSAEALAGARPVTGTPAQSRRRVAVAGIGLAATIGAALFGYHYWTVGRFLESTDDAYVGGDVTVIAPKVAGFIAEMAVTDNQMVHAGDLLVRLDDRDYKAALDRATAAVAAQTATLANLDASRQLQLSVINAARAGVSAADAETVRSRDDQVRFKALAADNAASVQVFQKADAEYKQAVASGERSRAQLEAAKRQLDVIAAQRQQAEAALAGAQADLETAKLNLGYTELRAPVDGYVGNRSGRPGAYATIGAQLLSVVPAKGLWVDANFKESQLAHMLPGQKVTVEADVLPGQTFHGTVVSVAPATGAQFSILPPENATGNFTKIVQRVPVRVALAGDAATLGRLRPGLSVTAEVNQKGS
jgi:membrane fusion protein (multidrug efflux system)